MTRFILYPFLLILTIVYSNRSDSLTILQKKMYLSDFYQQLFDNYSSYKENSIQQRRFKHSTLKGVLEKLKKDKTLEITTIGKSYQNRDIYLVKAGSGPTKVLLWSQMHGDEATATMALFDIFHFLSKQDESDPFS